VRELRRKQLSLLVKDETASGTSGKAMSTRDFKPPLQVNTAESL